MSTRWGLSFLLVNCFHFSSAAHADSWPIAVAHGKGEVVLKVEAPGSSFVLIVGQPDPKAGPLRVHVKSATTVTADPKLLAATEPLDPIWKLLRKEQQSALQRARAQRVSFYFDPNRTPPERKTFHLLTRDVDLDQTHSYAAIDAKLLRVGKWCQVYLDAREKVTPALELTLAEILRTFDDEIYPWTVKHLGRAHDIDRDGRFTIFLTASIAKIQGASPSLFGFVRSSDFLRELTPPFGNQCDMMYLRSDVVPGPHLRTLLIHEFVHAVVFSEHFQHPHAKSLRDEESWLNEGLAHLAEDLMGYSWSNLDYRIRAYLAAPEKYRLVVGDYFIEKLWRNPGTRGAAYLFLKWCHGQRGDALLTELAQSNFVGIENLEIALQKRFPEAFRAWTVAQVETPFAPRPTSPTFRAPLAGPFAHPLELSGGSVELDIAPTAAGYFLLQADAPGTYRVSAQAYGDFQLTLVSLPADVRREVVRGTLSKAKIHYTLPEGVTWSRLELERRFPGDLTTGDEPPLKLTVGDADLPERLRGHDLMLIGLGADRAGRRVTAMGWFK